MGPDIYQGAALPSTLLIGSTPKVAAVLMTYRILFEGFYPLLKIGRECLLFWRYYHLDWVI